MTSQPEALTEAQAAYEDALDRSEHLNNSTVSLQVKWNAIHEAGVAANKLIALQAARIASLEAEVAAAVAALKALVNWTGSDMYYAPSEVEAMVKRVLEASADDDGSAG